MERAQYSNFTGRTAAAALALLAAATTFACSGVGPRGQPVVFGDQTNIVIWDEAHHMEHFIRNASFKSGADNFGFIAPTPAKPELSQANQQAFYTLASLRPFQTFGSGGFGGGMGGASSASRAEVRVIQEADVAGYHATTVWSRDAHAINDWMNTHNYVSTPEVEKWAERYCARGWFLTAFRVIDQSRRGASTGTVRMSFKCKNPYNPFYVPASNIPNNGGSTLMVYFVSNGDYDATIGHVDHHQTWQVPQWTAPIPWNTSDLLAQQVQLKSGDIPNRAQVEAFVDNNFPRPAADDIYFNKRSRQARNDQPAKKPLRVSQLPITAGLFAGFGVLAVAWRRRTSESFLS